MASSASSPSFFFTDTCYCSATCLGLPTGPGTSWPHSWLEDWAQGSWEPPSPCQELVTAGTQDWPDQPMAFPSSKTDSEAKSWAQRGHWDQEGNFAVSFWPWDIMKPLQLSHVHLGDGASSQRKDKSKWITEKLSKSILIKPSLKSNQSLPSQQQESIFYFFIT